MTKYMQINLGRGRDAQALLMQTAIEKGVDVLLISEQYSKPTTGSWFQDSTGSSAIVVLNEDLKIRNVSESAENYVWVDIDGVKVYSCYFSPNIQYDDFLRKLETLEDSLRTTTGEVLVAGDFNCKSPEWGSKKLDKRGEALSEVVAGLDLVVLNEGDTFTFRRGIGGSVLDITLGSVAIAARTSTWRVLEDLTLSDHQYITFCVGKEPSKMKDVENIKEAGWVLRKLDRGQAKRFLEQEKRKGDLQRLVEAYHPEAVLNYAVTTIVSTCDAAMPRRKYRQRRRKPVYWWTPEIAELRKTCITARRKAQRARQKTEYPALELIYKQFRKELRFAIKRSQENCWKELIKSIDEDPWGLAYKIVTKKLVGRQQIPGLSCPKRKNQIVKALFPTHEQRPRKILQNQCDKIEPFSCSELQEAGKRLQPRKAPGPDNIPNEILKVVLEVWPVLLLEMYNNCLQNGIFHKKWKRQKLVLLRKGNKPLSEPSSYRPICLLDTMGKLLERMLFQRLEAHIKNSGGLSPRQYGFQKRLSTVDAIANVTEKAAKIKNGTRDNKGFCALVTLDVSNAFNTARWDIIMNVLTSRQTPEYLMQMINSYLSDRILIYDTDHGLVEYKVTSGVPQGSVLGPLLWNIMYDGLLNLDLPDGSSLVGFADDVAVLVTARTTATLEIMANESLRRVSNWLKENGLELAVQKTEAVLITDKRVFTPPTLMLEGQKVPWKKSLRYLGIQLDSSLRYADHVIRTTDNAATAAAILGRLMPNIGGPRESKRRILNTVVHSKILYAAEIWAEAVSKKYLRQKLASVQRRSALRVISAFRTVSEGAALVLASTPPIDLLIHEKQEIYKELRKYEECRLCNKKRAAIKKSARQRLLDNWQKRWDSDTAGRWTHHLIPRVDTWLNRTHGQVNYYLTQALTGHGCFNAYLKRFHKTDSAKCAHCGHYPDDVRHTIFECTASAKSRKSLNETLGGIDINVNNIISTMLDKENAWTAISAYVTRTMQEKRRLEEAERMAKSQPTPFPTETLAPEPQTP